MQAETYHNHATSLIHSTSDRKTLLAYKLCQAHISDYARKFLEAVSRYHELSFVGKIDENERTYMLYVYTTYFIPCIIETKCRRSVAVTCAVLAPAGPNCSSLFLPAVGESSFVMCHVSKLTNLLFPLPL